MGNGPLERQLKFEKKNKNLVKIPKYAKVEKRPIPHPPVASPYANASLPKDIYVSMKTPFMVVVKRAQKHLLQAEKRATANISLEDTRKTEQQKLAALAKASENREEVFIKAAGRAIEKALRVKEWFEKEENALEYTVRVKTGSVLVVDDIVEDEELKERELEKQKNEEQEKASATNTSEDQDKGKQSAKDKKRKREVAADPDDAETPETRTRWIKKVELAVSLK